MIFNFCPNCATENKEKKEDFVCTNCNKEFYQNSKPTASVIPVYQNKEILMSKRKKDPGKGKWDFIGGFLNNGEDPLDGAVREFEEETGYKLDSKDLILVDLVKVSPYIFQGDQMQNINLTYYINFPEKLTLIPNDDVDELKWVGINDPIDHAFEYQIDVLKHLDLTLNPKE